MMKTKTNSVGRASFFEARGARIARRVAAFAVLGVAAMTLAGPVRAQSAQAKKPTTLRGVLLAELKSTHNSEEWFAPADVAMKGLTPEQAAWRDAKGNHSVGQLAYHLWYWDRRSLMSLKGEKPEKYDGNNDETFDKFDPAHWNETVKNLDEVLDGLENWVETADEAKLAQNAELIAHICTHNAYHVGEMILVRKEQGVWNPANGVK
jgi:uncharacterized damage-inducible protein DinB